MNKISAIFQQMLILLLLLACSREERIFPRVEILSPAPGARFEYGDTLLLELVAEEADRLQARLLRGAQVYSLPQQLISSRANRQVWEWYFRDPYLPGGDYDLRVQAFRGEEGASAFRSLRYREWPLQWRGLVTLGPALLQKRDSLGGLNGQQSTASSFDYLALSSRDSVVLVAAASGALLQKRKLSDLSLIAEEPLPQAAGFRQYYGLEAGPRYLYSARADGQIWAYGGEGQRVASYSLSAPARPEAIASVAPGLAVIAREPGNPVSELILLSEDLRPNGQSLALLTGQYRPQFWHSGQIGLWRQQGQSLSFLCWQPGQAQPSSLFSLAASHLGRSVFVAPNQLFFSTEEGLYSFRENDLAPQKIMSGEVRDMAWDRSAEQLLILRPSLVQRLGPGNQWQFVQSVDPEAHHLALIYNK